MSETNTVERPVIPIAWAMPRTDGLVFDVICPKEHERYEGAYTLPLYALTHEQVLKLEEREIDKARTAPDLLESLITITNQLERVGDTRLHKDGQFIKDARAVIAAALGHNARAETPTPAPQR